MKVVSPNGKVHLASAETRVTSKKRDEKTGNFIKQPKRYDGYVRKECDGQWLSDTRRVPNSARVTCPACQRKEDH